MPLYDYKCPACGEEFEAMSSIERRDDMTCDCGKPAERLMTGGSFLLRGGGWAGKGHVNIHPPETDHSLTHGWKDNYYNCTPESVHKI